MIPTVSEEELADLYAWVDSIPLSKPKKSIARDFSDGVCVADMVHCYFPKLVELHNYSPASNSRKKMENWQTLNVKVMKKLGIRLSEETMKAVVFCEPGAIEGVLKMLRIKFVEYQQRLHSKGKVNRVPNGSPCKPYSTMTFEVADDGAMEGKRHKTRKYKQQHENNASLGKKSSEEIDVTVLQQDESVEYVTENVSMDSSTNSENVNSNVMEGGNQFKRKELIQSAMPPKELTSCEREENHGQIVDELRNVVRLLELKCAKQDQIIRLKDAKITALTQALENNGLTL